MNDSDDDMTPEEMAELVAYFEAHAGDMSIWDTSKPKKIRVRRGGPSHVFSVRFSADEMERIEEAADANGITMTELIRSGALTAAASGQAGALRAIEEKAKELTEAVRKLRAS